MMKLLNYLREIIKIVLKNTWILEPRMNLASIRFLTLDSESTNFKIKMSEKYLNLYLEIKSSNFIFYVQENDDENNFKIKYKLDIPAIGLEDNKIIDFDNFFETIKKNIYLAEQSQKCTFKEVVLILDNLNTTFVNLSGYKN